MRKIGIAMAVLVACSATAFVGFLFDSPRSGWRSDNSWGTPAAIAAAALAWVGVWGWTQRRYWVAALGAWAAIWGNFWLWSLVVVPIAFALVTTTVAIANAFRRPVPNP